MHNWGIRTHDLVHTFALSNHYAASVNVSLCYCSLWQRLYTRITALLGRITWRLVSDIRRGPRSAPRTFRVSWPGGPWLRSPGPASGSIPGVKPRSRWHARSLSFEAALTGRGAWLHPVWELLARGWADGLSKCNEHIRRGSLWAGHCQWNWNCHCGPGHQCLRHWPVTLAQCHASSESDCRASKHEE